MLIVALAGAWPLMLWLRVVGWADLGILPNPRRWRDMAWGAIIGLFGLGSVALWTVHLGRAEWVSAWRWHLIAEAMGTAVVIALIEEYFFRGILLGALRRRLPWPWALTLLSLIFAALHFLRKPAVRDAAQIASDLPWDGGFDVLPTLLWQFGEPRLIVGGFCTLFWVGWTLGYTVVRTQSLAMALGLHAGWVFALRAFHFNSQRVGDVDMWLGADLITGILPAALVLFSLFVVHGIFVWQRRKRCGPPENCMRVGLIVLCGMVMSPALADARSTPTPFDAARQAPAGAAAWWYVPHTNDLVTQGCTPDFSHVGQVLWAWYPPAPTPQPDPNARWWPRLGDTALWIDPQTHAHSNTHVLRNTSQGARAHLLTGLRRGLQHAGFTSLPSAASHRSPSDPVTQLMRHDTHALVLFDDTAWLGWRPSRMVNHSHQTRTLADHAIFQQLQHDYGGDAAHHIRMAGSIAIPSVYAYWQQHPAHIAFVELMMRLGLHQAQSIDLIADTHHTTHAWLRTPRLDVGLTRVLGPAVPMHTIAAIPPTAVAAAMVSVVPREAQLTMERVFSGVNALLYSALRLQLDHLETQLGKRWLEDGIGSAPGIWLAYEMPSAPKTTSRTRSQAAPPDRVAVLEVADAQILRHFADAMLPIAQQQHVAIESIRTLLGRAIPRHASVMRWKRHSGETFWIGFVGDHAIVIATHPEGLWRHLNAARLSSTSPSAAASKAIQSLWQNDSVHSARSDRAIAYGFIRSPRYSWPAVATKLGIATCASSRASGHGQHRDRSQHTTAWTMTTDPKGYKVTAWQK